MHECYNINIITNKTKIMRKKDTKKKKMNLFAHGYKDIWASLVAQLVKESTCNARDPSLIPGSGRSAGEGISYPLQYSWASLMTQMVKNPPAMWETWV